MALLATSGSAWLYWSGIRTLEAQNAPVVDSHHPGTQQIVSRFINQTNLVALEVVKATAAGSGTLLLALLLGWFWWQRRLRHQADQINLAAAKQFQHLQALAANSAILTEEAHRLRVETEKRLASLAQTHDALSRNYEDLQGELNQRKQAERSLAQQTQQLERSKDVLELHVQARTQELQKLQRRNELILLIPPARASAASTCRAGPRSSTPPPPASPAGKSRK